MVFKSATYWALCILFFSVSEIKAQVCPGGRSIPILINTFGYGQPHFRGTLGQLSNYQYLPGTPNDGQFTIVKNTIGMNTGANGWHQVTEHTGETQDGYMMVINGDKTLGHFFVTTPLDVCPNTTYKFSAWIMNLLNYAGPRPDVRFSIETIGGNILATYDTQEIEENIIPTWKEYGLSFKNIAETHVILRLSILTPKGPGNEIAIDDISFTTCGPLLNATIEDNGLTASICSNQSKIFTLKGDTGPGLSDPVFQWQFLSNGLWVDIVNETTLQTSVNFNNATPGVYNYRLTTAERPNITSEFCRTISQILTITVNDIPVAASNSGPDCEGTNIQLFAGTGVSYSWTGPNGYTSNSQNPILNSVTINDAGAYEVTVTNSSCTSTSQTQVQVLPMVTPATNITSATLCENESIQLVASGGLSYSWLPIAGLSNPNIANPIATPTKNMVYTVKISNGQCSENRQIEITVLKNATISAGTDKKILLGQSIALNGIATGDNISYYWTPTDYLDHPTKLNPIANPPTDIIYTLHVESSCGNLTDDVAIKVYPKLEIPTAFTPNGDGINDTWSIPALTTFTNPRLIVVNRYGRPVFEGSNNPPWDGKSKGKDLPIGAYYYTLYINKNYKIYAGWVLITR